MLDLTRRKLPYNVLFRKCWTWLGFCTKAPRNFKSPMESHQARLKTLESRLLNVPTWFENICWTSKTLDNSWPNFFLNGVQLLLALCQPIAKTTFTFSHFFSTLAGSGCIPLASKIARSGCIPLIIHLSFCNIILFPKHRDLQYGSKHRLSKRV